MIIVTSHTNNQQL